VDVNFVDDINDILELSKTYEERVQQLLRKQLSTFQSDHDKMDHMKQLIEFTDLHVPKNMDALNK
jgi:hypothetical protein